MGLFKLFKKSAKEEAVSPKELLQQQEKIADEAMSVYYQSSSRELLAWPKGHFKDILNVLDQHDVIDLKSIPVQGVGNGITSVPEPWARHCVAILKHAFDPEVFAGRAEEMEKALKSLPPQFYKLRFQEEIEENTLLEHTVGSVVRNQIAKAVRMKKADVIQISDFQNVPHREEAGAEALAL